LFKTFLVAINTSQLMLKIHAATHVNLHVNCPLFSSILTKKLGCAGIGVSS
jgi:hypothetical protein